MKIVTGYTGSPHITSNDEQGKNQGIFGTGNSVLDVGNKFNATLTNANTVTIEDGEGVMQGVHFRIEPGTTETVNIQNGTSGYQRTDLICARYTKNAVTGVEAVNLVVIAGTPSSSTPTEPSYTQGDILGGDTLAEFPLWKVTLDGLTPTVTRIFNVSNAGRPTEIGDLTINSSNVARDDVLYSDETVTLEPGHLYLVQYRGQLSIAPPYTVGDQLAILILADVNNPMSGTDIMFLYYPNGVEFTSLRLVSVYSEAMTVNLKCIFSSNIPASGTTANISAFVVQLT